MNKCYLRIVWKNYPNAETPLNEHNLNKIDVATDEMDNRIILLDSTKFDKSEAQMLVKYIEYDENTGVFKITHYNGASYTIDTLLEKLAINFDYDYVTQRLIIELSDGTVKYVDLSALLTQYEFLNSETVAFTVDSSGKVSAQVKEGSIKEKHLQPNYLADIKVEVAKAESEADSASESASDSMHYAKQSQSYAVGTGNVRPGEDTDNAKYYSEQAQKVLESLGQAGTVTGVKGNKEITYRTGNVNLTSENIGALAEDGDSVNNMVNFTSLDSDSPTAWTNVSVLASGEKHGSLFRKISTMIKNVRWIYKMLGTTNISAIGGGTVTGALSALNTDLAGKQDKLTNPLIQADVVDNLSSTAAKKPLSANQGKILNDKISQKSKVFVQLAIITGNGSDWAIVSNANKYLITAQTVRDDTSFYVKGINKQNAAGAYALIFSEDIAKSAQQAVWLTWID